MPLRRSCLATMRQLDCEVLLILDSVNILYATGASNMTLFTTRTPSRYLLLFVDGPSILFDYREATGSPSERARP